MLLSRLLAYHALSAICKPAAAAPLYRNSGSIVAKLGAAVPAIDADTAPNASVAEPPVTNALARRQAPNATETSAPSTGCRAHNDSPCPFTPPVPTALRGNGSDPETQADEAHVKPWDRHPSPEHPLKGGLIPLHAGDIPNVELASIDKPLLGRRAAETVAHAEAAAEAEAMAATTDAKPDAPVDRGESSSQHAHGREIAIAADDPWCLDYKAANAIIRFYMFCQHPHWHCIGVW